MLYVVFILQSLSQGTIENIGYCKREDQNQKLPAHDDGVDDEKELPTARVPMSSQNNSQALSGQETSDAHEIPHETDEECSHPEKPIIVEECESENEIPGSNNTPNWQVGGLW
jgi:hypothetical protein